MTSNRVDQVAVSGALQDHERRVRILEATPPGGAISWSDVGAACGSSASALAHADILSGSQFWWNGASSATLAANASGYLSFEPGDNTPLITNDASTFTLDQYQALPLINESSVYGLGCHGVGTYDFNLSIEVVSDAPLANAWEYSIPFQVVNLVNSELGGGNWTGNAFLTFVGYQGTIGSSTAYFGFTGLQRIAIVDTDGGSPTPAPITIIVNNPSTGFTIQHNASAMSVTKIANDDTGF